MSCYLRQTQVQDKINANIWDNGYLIVLPDFFILKYPVKIYMPLNNFASKDIELYV